MVRITNVPPSKARRKKRNKLAKGFTGRNKNLNRVTSGVLKRAMAFQYVGRKLRKRDFRALWVTRIGIAARNQGTTYARFMSGLKKAGIALNRKVLSDLAVTEKSSFEHLIRITLEA